MVLYNKDLCVLSAVCIEKPNATLKSVSKRTGALTGKFQGIVVTASSLSRLEDNSLVRREENLSNNKNKPLFFPTKEGLNKNNEFAIGNTNIEEKLILAIA
jgi:hypothetical protein